MFQFHHITLREMLAARGLSVRVTYDVHRHVYHLNDDAGYERNVSFEHVDDLIFAIGLIKPGEEYRDATLRLIQAHIDAVNERAMVLRAMAADCTNTFPTLDEAHDAFIKGANAAPAGSDVSATDRAGLQAVLDLIKKRLGK
jgi:hypothetical protein